MVKIRELLHKTQRKFVKLRLQPIHVFCFHQVSETFDVSTMYPGDWTPAEQFKRNIEQLKKRYTFIQLQEAYKKLHHDLLRTKKYAVLTADDGWASLKNVLQWLAEQQIPITLFVNPAYLKGEETRENGMSGLLTWEELNSLLVKYKNITIASHGWNHTLLEDMNTDAFYKSVFESHRFLKKNEQYIPFYAYPCGQHSQQTDAIIKQMQIVPVYMDGQVNYKYNNGIHRELLDGLKLS